MLRCASCGAAFRSSFGPGLICSNCWDNSRGEKSRRQHARRRFPAPVGPHNDPRPPELRQAGEEPTVILVPLASDEPSAA
jgi:hypothetical protein